MSVCKGWFGNCKICFVMKLQVMLCYGFSKERVLIQLLLFFLSELVLVTVGIEVGKVPFFKPQVGKMFFGQTIGGEIICYTT